MCTVVGVLVHHYQLCFPLCLHLRTCPSAFSCLQWDNIKISTVVTFSRGITRNLRHQLLCNTLDQYSFGSRPRCETEKSLDWTKPCLKKLNSLCIKSESPKANCLWHRDSRHASDVVQFNLFCN